MNNDWIIPNWPAPCSVRAIQTTRRGGFSQDAFAEMNLAMHVHDDTKTVQRNRDYLRQYLPAEPIWLNQIHGVQVVDAQMPKSIDADASFTRNKNIVCAVMTADCLPVLFCDKSASVVAAAHAGWRGLCEGILEATVQAMQMPTENLMAWLGPAIGPHAFEVGDEVRQAFIQKTSGASVAFHAKGDKWLADIYQLAKLRLNNLGINEVYGGEYCTVSDAQRFFSYRRDQQCGRMASLIWLE